MSPVLESTARALLRRVAVEQAESRLPSLAVAVVRDGRLAWFGSRGRVEGARPPRPPSTGSDRSPRAWSPPWSCGCATRAAWTCSTRSPSTSPASRSAR
ncbi:hypothetical protein ACFQX6_11815 [Streptosporangium lutulentum]